MRNKKKRGQEIKRMEKGEGKRKMRKKVENNFINHNKQNMWKDKSRNGARRSNSEEILNTLSSADKKGLFFINENQSYTVNTRFLCEI